MLINLNIPPKTINIDYSKSCYIRANDNINFPSKEYIESIMKIKYVNYFDSISTTQLRNSEIISHMNNTLSNLTSILEKNNIPYYLHDKLYYNCMKYGKIFPDVPITIKAKIDNSKSDNSKSEVILWLLRQLQLKNKYELINNKIYINNGCSIIITIINEIPELKRTLLLGKLYYIYNPVNGMESI